MQNARGNFVKVKLYCPITIYVTAWFVVAPVGVEMLHSSCVFTWFLSVFNLE